MRSMTGLDDVNAIGTLGERLAKPTGALDKTLTKQGFRTDDGKVSFLSDGRLKVRFNSYVPLTPEEALSLASWLLQYATGAMAEQGQKTSPAATSGVGGWGA